MSDHDFDRLIDNAARQLISHRPSRQLKAAVMARIGGAEPAAPRRVMWATAAVAVALCGVASVLMNRDQVTVGKIPAVHAPAVQGSGAREAAVEMPARPAVMTDQLRDGTRHETTVALVPARAAGTVTRPTRSSIQPPSGDLSTIPPLETEPITLAVVEVPPLASETVVFEQIEIEPLAIEPLTASND